MPETRGAPAAEASDGGPRATASLAGPERGGRGPAVRGDLRGPPARPRRREEQALGTRPPPPSRLVGYGFTSFAVKCEDRGSRLPGPRNREEDMKQSENAVSAKEVTMPVSCKAIGDIEEGTIPQRQNKGT